MTAKPTLVVIPTYNEVDNISNLVSSLFSIAPSSVDILVVDDSSPDGTANQVLQLAHSGSRLHLLQRSGKLGLGTAYVEGFQWGLKRGYDILVEMDADFSHHPRYLLPLLEVLKVADFAIGSRSVPGGGVLHWGILRRMLSTFGSLYARSILGVPIRDFTGGFNGWHRRVLEAIGLSQIRSDGYSFQIELKYRAAQKGFQWLEFPIIFEDRKKGASKMNKKIILEALYRVWELRYQK